MSNFRPRLTDDEVDREIRAYGLMGQSASAVRKRFPDLSVRTINRRMAKREMVSEASWLDGIDEFAETVLFLSEYIQARLCMEEPVANAIAAAYVMDKKFTLSKDFIEAYEQMERLRADSAKDIDWTKVLGAIV